MRKDLPDEEKTRIRDEWTGKTRADLDRAIVFHMDTNRCPFTRERELCGFTDCPFLEFAKCPIVLDLFGKRGNKEDA